MIWIHFKTGKYCTVIQNLGHNILNSSINFRGLLVEAWMKMLLLCDCLCHVAWRFQQLSHTVKILVSMLKGLEQSMSFPHHQNLLQGVVNLVCHAFSYLKLNSHVEEKIKCSISSSQAYLFLFQKGAGIYQLSRDTKKYLQSDTIL